MKSGAFESFVNGEYGKVTTSDSGETYSPIAALQCGGKALGNAQKRMPRKRLYWVGDKFPKPHINPRGKFISTRE